MSHMTEPSRQRRSGITQTYGSKSGSRSIASKIGLAGNIDADETKNTALARPPALIFAAIAAHFAGNEA